MAYEQQIFTCPVCRQPTAHTRKEVNHILHLLISFLLCGLWIPVWILLSLVRDRWQCQQCGHCR